MTRELTTGAVIVLSAALLLPAQSLDERKAKQAAEAMYAVAIAVGGPNRLVINKPYSGEAITETVQTLADGNRIVRHNTTRYYRDRSGRTRREQVIETLGTASLERPAHIIVISDPVSKTDYILDPDRQTVKKFGRLETEIVGEPTVSASNTEDLGTRVLDNLRCTGARVKTVIAVGQHGNERPIIAVTETWYSQAIEAVVQSMTSDPRFGIRSYSLRNVTLAEQAPSLFEPPPSYRVEFEGKPGTVMKRLIVPQR